MSERSVTGADELVLDVNAAGLRRPRDGLLTPATIRTARAVREEVARVAVAAKGTAVVLLSLRAARGQEGSGQEELHLERVSGAMTISASSDWEWRAGAWLRLGP